MMVDRSFSRWLVAGMLCLANLTYAGDEPKWARVSTSHYSLLTDAGEKKSFQTIVRLEQMRSVLGGLLLKTRLKLSEPLDVIAVRSDEEYIALAPVRDGRPIAQSAFFLAGDDRNYIVLDLADEKSWQIVTRDFVYLYLKYNYPPAQSWFDDGLAEYFSTLQLDDKQGEIGAAPTGFMEALSTKAWIPLPELFAAPRTSGDVLLRAQAWLVMHYLINQNKLPETGAYFDLVMNQKVSPEEAIHKAYGMTVEQFGHALKDYFHSIQPSPPAKAGDTAGSGGVKRFIPATLLEIGPSSKLVLPAEAQSLLAELKVRMPEHRDAAIKELDALIDEPLAENSIQHRARAWMLLQKNEPDEAAQELEKALAINQQDPWAHYYRARMKFREALGTGDTFPGLANMLVDLRMVLDWNREFAEAFNMLAMGRVEGGGATSALEAMRAALELNPRNEGYQLNMALVLLGGKKWDDANALLEHLKASPNARIADAARGYLADLPNMRKYGMLPKRAVDRSALPAGASKAAAKVEEAEEDAPRQPDAQPEPDKRKIQFSKGRLLRVDCSQAPLAVLTVATASKTLRLKTTNYQSLLLVGADSFSCDWKNVPVTVNFKAGGKADGDLVSLELQ